MKFNETLTFKYTTSKGRETYGYTICSLWIRGKKVASCNGGGYDMKGVVFAEYLKTEYEGRISRLKILRSNDFYGLSFMKRLKSGKYRSLKRYSERAIVSLDGTCGMSAMERISPAIGLTMICVHESYGQATYSLEDTKGEVK